MTENFESRMGRLGAQLDELMERAKHEGHRVDDVVAKLRAGVDDTKVRLNLAKMEATEKAEPVLEQIAGVLVEIEDSLDAVAESIRKSVSP
jgi:hypothetical protein